MVAVPAGPRVLRDTLTDVAGIKVGHWTSRRLATGCTVVLCPPSTVGGVDVRGGAPGTRETDLLRPGNLVDEVHAVVLAGGSAFGLDAASGVTRFLEERGIGFPFGGRCVPIVPAAILFDLNLGSAAHPQSVAGYRAAARASGGGVDEGSVGAGTGATVAKHAGAPRMLKGGIGTASERLDTGVVVAALAAVNAAGSIRDPRTAEIIAAPRANGAGFIDLDAHLRSGRRWPELPDADQAGEAISNTTIAVVATNAALTREQANRLAAVCQDGFARSTWPAHGRSDGDVIFALATGEIPVNAPGMSALEALATRATERAVLRGVRLATGLDGVPSAAEWACDPGSYPIEIPAS